MEGFLNGYHHQSKKQKRNGGNRVKRTTGNANDNKKWTKRKGQYSKFITHVMIMSYEPN